jgi:hypothetical protein
MPDDPMRRRCVGSVKVIALMMVAVLSLSAGVASAGEASTPGSRQQPDSDRSRSQRDSGQSRWQQDSDRSRSRQHSGESRWQQKPGRSRSRQHSGESHSRGSDRSHWQQDPGRSRWRQDPGQSRPQENPGRSQEDSTSPANPPPPPPVQDPISGPVDGTPAFVGRLSRATRSPVLRGHDTQSRSPSTLVSNKASTPEGSTPHPGPTSGLRLEEPPAHSRIQPTLTHPSTNGIPQTPVLLQAILMAGILLGMAFVYSRANRLQQMLSVSPQSSNRLTASAAALNGSRNEGGESVVDVEPLTTLEHPQLRAH